TIDSGHYEAGYGGEEGREEAVLVGRREGFDLCSGAGVRGAVAQVARRYAMNANLIHKWLRDPLFAPDDADAEAEVAEFLPVEIEGVASSPIASRLPSPPTVSGAPLSVQRVDITLSDGRRILVEGNTALSAVMSLVEGLMP
ncbi:transposase, partial [Aliiroseovarius crassostreae]